jgi:5-methylcytosine-specific restriction protein A
MPNSPKTICPGAGCRKIVLLGTRCPEHARTEFAGTTKNRSGDPFYSSKRWRRLRAAKLMANPLCECEACKANGSVTPADTVDHIEPRCERPYLEWDWSNLQSMSTSHHNRKTFRERTGNRVISN